LEIMTQTHLILKKSMTPNSIAEKQINKVTLIAALSSQSTNSDSCNAALLLVLEISLLHRKLLIYNSSRSSSNNKGHARTFKHYLRWVLNLLDLF